LSCSAGGKWQRVTGWTEKYPEKVGEKGMFPKMPNEEKTPPYSGEYFFHVIICQKRCEESLRGRPGARKKRPMTLRKRGKEEFGNRSLMYSGKEILRHRWRKGFGKAGSWGKKVTMQIGGTNIKADLTVFTA